VKGRELLSVKAEQEQGRGERKEGRERRVKGE
jgi:hypothetical protein